MTIQDLRDHTALIEDVARRQRALMTEDFRRTAREIDEARSRDTAFDGLTQAALLRLLKSDPEFASGLDALVSQPIEAPSAGEIDALVRRPSADPAIAELARHVAPELDGGPGQRVMSGQGMSVTLGPPYQYVWKEAIRAHAQSAAQVYPATGDMWARGSVASIGDGAFHAAAAVGVPFWRKVDGLAEGKGPEGLAWISPRMSGIESLWTDRPQMANTALGGRMGIQVRSWDFNGQDSTLELDSSQVCFSHWSVMFGTAGNSQNYAWNSLFPFADTIFRIRPDRVYLAWICCQVWGSGQNMWLRTALVSSQLGARVESVTIGQT